MHAANSTGFIFFSNPLDDLENRPAHTNDVRIKHVHADMWRLLDQTTRCLIDLLNPPVDVHDGDSVGAACGLRKQLDKTLLTLRKAIDANKPARERADLSRATIAEPSLDAIKSLDAALHRLP